MYFPLVFQCLACEIYSSLAWGKVPNIPPLGADLHTVSHLFCLLLSNCIPAPDILHKTHTCIQFHFTYHNTGRLCLSLNLVKLNTKACISCPCSQLSLGLFLSAHVFNLVFAYTEASICIYSCGVFFSHLSHSNDRCATALLQ